MRDDIYQPKRIPRRRIAVLRGVEHAVAEWGDPDSPPVIYLHGWGDTGSTFQFVVDELDGDHRIVAPDFRGFGKSQKTGPAYWFPDYLADLDALLGIYSPDRPVTLIGHSMGANVAGLYAGAMPERVSAFVNIEGFGLRDSNPADAPGHYRRFVEAGRDPKPFSSYADYAGLIRRIVKRSPRMTADRAGFVAREWAEQSDDGTVTLRMDPAHKLPNAVLYRRQEAEACWRTATARMLLVYGADTEFLDWPEFAQWLASGDDVAAVPEAGHMVHFEAPGALAALLERFLSAL